MAHDRDVGGIRCLEVLAHLADYVDGDVEPALRQRIEAHLAGCDWCERFGGSYASTVGELRRVLAEPEPLSRPMQERLERRLSQAQLGGSDP